MAAFVEYTTQLLSIQQLSGVFYKNNSFVTQNNRQRTKKNRCIRENVLAQNGWPLHMRLVGLNYWQYWSCETKIIAASLCSYIDRRTEAKRNLDWRQRHWRVLKLYLHPLRIRFSTWHIMYMHTVPLLELAVVVFSLQQLMENILKHEVMLSVV